MRKAKTGKARKALRYDRARRAETLTKRVDDQPPALHSLAELFPPMTDAQFDVLASSILKEGLKEPITTYDGLVLDGRNRLAACEKYEITPEFVELPEGEDPLEFVMRKNLARRQMDPSQLAMVGEELATMPHGGNRKSKNADDQGPNLRLEDAAQMVGVSKSMISMARRLRSEDTNGTLVDSVKRGTLTLNAAIKKLEEREERRSKKGGLSEDEKVERAIHKLSDLALKDIRQFEKAVASLTVKSSSGVTKFQALQAVAKMIDLKASQIDEAKNILDHYQGKGNTHGRYIFPDL